MLRKKVGMFPHMIDKHLPATVDDAADTLLADLSLRERTRLAHLSEDEMELISGMVGAQIIKDFRLWSGNDALLQDCLSAAGEGEKALEPELTIVRAMWRKLQQTHVLRLVP